MQASESLFDRLPDETISRIFTIGCDLDVALWQRNELDTRRRLISPLYEREKPSPDPFAANALAVCRRWYLIVHARSNAHMWRIFACLGPFYGDLSYTSEKPWISGSTLATFKNRLSSSNGCDIYLEYCANEDFSSFTSLEIRTLVLLMTFIKPYRNRIAFLKVYATHHASSLILRIMRAIGEWPRLHTVDVVASVDVPNHGESDQTASSAITLHLIEVLESTSQGDTPRETRPMFSSLEQIYFWLEARGALHHEMLQLIHHGLRSLTIMGDGHQPTISWTDFRWIMTCCPMLQSLIVTTTAAPRLEDTSPTETSLAPIEHQLQILGLRIQDAAFATMVFRHFRLPNLRYLAFGYLGTNLSPDPNIELSDLHSTPSNIESTLTGTEPSVPSLADSLKLNRLVFGGMPFRDYQSVAGLLGEGPPLDTLQLSGVVRRGTWLKDAPSRPPVQLCRSPKRILLQSIIRVHELLEALSAVDLRMTNTLDINISEAEHSLEFPGPRLEMPSLSSISVSSYLTCHLGVLNYLLAHLRCPKLSILKANSHEGAVISCFAEDEGAMPNPNGCFRAFSRLEIETGGEAKATMSHIQDFFQNPLSLSIYDLHVVLNQVHNVMNELIDISNALAWRRSSVILPNLRRCTIKVIPKEGIRSTVPSFDVWSPWMTWIAESRRNNGMVLEKLTVIIFEEEHVFA
jgi:hypothetical protein